MDAFRNQRTPYVYPGSKPTKPSSKVGRRVVSTKPMTDPSYDDAFNLFRHTMQTLRQYTPQTDTAAISAPYAAASAAVPSLSAGLQSAINDQTQKSLQQYGTARDAAASNVSSFGAAAGGAGTPAAPIQDRGSDLIANQGQTNATAALQAGPAQQALIERARLAAVSRAELSREGLIQQGIASAATAIPSLTQQNRTRDFQQNVADQNYLMALGTQKDKASEAQRQFLLDKLRLEQEGAYQTGQLQLGQGRLAETTAHDQATEKYWNQRIAQGKAAGARFKLNGVSGALSTLRGPSSSSTKKQQQGYVVEYQAADDQGKYGPTLYARGVAQNWTPGPGNEVISSVPYYVTAPGSSTKFSWSRYKAAAGQLRAQNPGITQQQIIQVLGPTPKTGPKKKK